jgi:hypothetical protein
MKLAVIFLLFSVFTAFSLSVTNVITTVSDSTTPEGNKIWTGTLSYDLDEDSWTWLELSRDNGTTWNQRLIHGTGAIGHTAAGNNKQVKWMVDGDQGLSCRIRVRANSAPYTYSDKDADNNKYPFPLPDDTYENIERLTGTEDQFDFAVYPLPPADFFKKVSSGGQCKAGFAKEPVQRDWANPARDNYFSAAYFESGDGTEKFFIISSSTITVDAKYLVWKDSVEHWYGIPKEHVYWACDHLHQSDIAEPELIKPMFDSAIARAEPIQVAFMDYAMPRGIVHNRNAYSGAAGEYVTSLFSLGATAGAGGPLLCGGLEWEIEGSDTTGVFAINATEGASVQRLYDQPTDSYLQFIFFKNNVGEYKGLIMKITGHPEYTTTEFMDSLAFYLGGAVGAEGSFDKIIGGPVVLRYIGYAGNHVEIMRGYNDGVNFTTTGQEETVRRFCRIARQVINDSVSTLDFSPVSKIGMTKDRSDVYGNPYSTLGTGPMVMCFNDVYLTGVPCEAPSQAGMYLRARTIDKKVLYNAYLSSEDAYWSWGRMFQRTGYDQGRVFTKEASFNITQDVIRGINILEQSN